MLVPRVSVVGPLDDDERMKIIYTRLLVGDARTEERAGTWKKVFFQ